MHLNLDPDFYNALRYQDLFQSDSLSIIGGLY